MRRKMPLGLVLFAFLLVTAWSLPAEAQSRHTVHAYPRHAVYVGGYFGAYAYSSWWYPYPYWHYPPYPFGFGYGYGYPSAGASLKTQVEPKTAEVYVDGDLAGIVDQFDGFFQSLDISPGGHEITIYLDGYKSITERLYLRIGAVTRIKGTMVKLEPGQPNDPRPVPAPEPAGPEPAAGPPARPPFERRVGDPAQARFGQLAIRVQPADADVLIDGEVWRASQGQDRLVVHLLAGPHRVEIRKDGYVTFENKVQVNAGDTFALNVSLSERR